jgi:hypothetical protein
MPPAFQQTPVGYQQPPAFFPPTGFMPPPGQYQQPFFPQFQQQTSGNSSQVANAVKPKRKKKKNGQQGATGPQGSIPVPIQAAFPQPQMPFMHNSAIASGDALSTVAGPSTVSPVAPAVQSEVSADADADLAKKVVKCWKCAVDTHATKECKVQHFCLVCDNGAHPTVRCPTLKMPRQLSFVAGSGCEDSLFLQLPGSAFKAHLAPKGSPTALIKIVGDPVPAVAIENLLARICHLSSQWKWEAIPHGSDAFLVGFPSAEDLSRMDGMQMGIPSSTSQMSITSWQIQDVPHKLELQKVWVHVDGVPHTVRHFLGLWAVASLVGTPVDVDLVTLRSRGVVRVRVAMMDPKNLQNRVDTQGRHCLGVTVAVDFKVYDFLFRQEQPDFVPDTGFVPYFWRR